MSAPTQPTDTTAVVGHAPDSAEDYERRQQAGRRSLERGGRRRIDWPDDAGMSACPGCGHEHLQSLGTLDSGDYLWQCPHCDRRFQTGRASRAML